MFSIEGQIIYPVRSPEPKGTGSRLGWLTSNGVNTNGLSRKRVVIGNDGLIAAVLDATGQADLVLNDELIFPGFIDLHVHAREDSGHAQDYKEDFTTAGLAAINGGVTAFAEMPNNPVPPIDEKSYFNKQQLVKKSASDVLLYAGIGPHTEPFSVPFRVQPRNPLTSNQVQDKGSFHSSSYAFGFGRDGLAQVPYKAFMGKSVGDLFFNSLSELEIAIAKYRGQSVSFHCEQPEILAAHSLEASHEKQRPAEAEILAVDFALRLIEKYELYGKICHCSTMEGLNKIISAKKSGLPVTVEVTPHHLYFDSDVIARNASDEAIFSKDSVVWDAFAMTKMLQVNPPIRQSRQNRLALIAALKNGDIDYLATDHAPHTIEEKEKGMSGIPHLDTYGPFTAWLMSEHGFTPVDIARVCANNPGKFIGQFMDEKFGKIEPGFVGSLTIMDMKRPITVEKSQLKTKCGWSPFEGVTFPGSVAYTIIKGKVYKQTGV